MGTRIMDRRTFTKTIVLSSSALMIGPQISCATHQDGETSSKTAPSDFKKVFWKKGACSTALFFIINREFGHLKATEELAAAPLAGGMMGKGYQCGMLWGASLAVGAESFRRCKNVNQAISMAMRATQYQLESFTTRTKCINCRDITKCDWNSKMSMAKHLLSGRVMICFNLIEKWAPEAIRSAHAGLSHAQTDVFQMPISCASEVARRMGASDEEMVMVAGFAGGIGLSGNACGALGAALWMNTLAWCRKNPGKTPPFFNNPSTVRIMKAFYNATGSEILCHKITGHRFKTIAEHTEFMQCKGCEKLIDLISHA
jgi:hypothetical protein